MYQSIKYIAGNFSIENVIYIVYKNSLFVFKLNVNMRRIALCYTD